MSSGYWVAMRNIKITTMCWLGVVAHASSPRTNEAQASRATLATEQEPLSKTKQQQQHNKRPSRLEGKKHGRKFYEKHRFCKEEGRRVQMKRWKLPAGDSGTSE